MICKWKLAPFIGRVGTPYTSYTLATSADPFDQVEGFESEARGQILQVNFWCWRFSFIFFWGFYFRVLCRLGTSDTHYFPPFLIIVFTWSKFSFGEFFPWSEQPSKHSMCVRSLRRLPCRKRVWDLRHAWLQGGAKKSINLLVFGRLIFRFREELRKIFKKNQDES